MSAVCSPVQIERYLTYGDVVTDTKDASAVSVLDAVLLAGSGESPVVRIAVNTNSITKMVITVAGSLLALRCINAPRILLDPLAIVSGALLLVVGGLAVSSVGDVGTVVLGLDVLALGFVIAASALVVGPDSNVLPHGRVPVGVVITLLSALKSILCSSSVLAGGHSTIAITWGFSGDPETLVALTLNAGLVVAVGLVHSIEELTIEDTIGNLPVVVVGGSGVSIGGDTGLRATISDSQSLIISLRTTHVLEDNLTTIVINAARVLVGPLDSKDRTFVVVHCSTPAVSSSCIVLAVEQTSGGLTITFLLESVVVARWVLEVNVSQHCSNAAQRKKYK